MMEVLEVLDNPNDFVYAMMKAAKSRSGYIQMQENRMADCVEPMVVQ